MGDLEFDLLKFKEDKWGEALSLDDEKITFGRLKALEDLVNYLNVVRESLTKQLVLNGARDCETDDDLKERWKKLEKKSSNIETE